MPRTVAKYGWKPDLPDHRDHYFSVVVQPTALPAKVDLRPQCPAVYDQGQLGSCTANAIGAAFEFEQMKEKIASWVPSRLFIYYNERVMEGDVSQDNGAQIRDGMRSVNVKGVCPESEWPYDINAFANHPPTKCYTDALKNKLVSYSHVPQTLSMMKSCLASGYPFVFGFTVYESFEGDAIANTGMMPMPAKSEQVVGGHAVLAVGFDDSMQRMIVRNSWGSGWGAAGYFYMPYAYITDTSLCDDFWTMRVVA